MTLRVDFGAGRAIGRGKIQLLEAIRDHGSITGAGRALGMSYKRAWELVDDLNACFQKPLVAARTGGQQGGGAALTPLGAQVIADYRGIEAKALDAAERHLRSLEAALRRAPKGEA